MPSEKRIAMHVTRAAERALRDGHPWLFADSIRKQSHEGASGDLAVIFDAKRRFLAIGLYDPDSPIRVRVLQHHQQATIDGDWFTERIRAAAQIRAPLLDQDTDGYRLVHGENDGLPGLVIDRYADTLVVKVYTSAWLPHLRDVVAALKIVLPHERIVFRASRNIGPLFDDDAPRDPVIFRENGLLFAADVVRGHKTGFFFDQRENRERVRALAAGRRVLDVFAYSGGFSVYAAAGGASHVTSLDVSAPALDAAVENFRLNDLRVDHRVLVGDAFDTTQGLHQAGETIRHGDR